MTSDGAVQQVYLTRHGPLSTRTIVTRTRHAATVLQSCVNPTARPAIVLDGHMSTLDTDANRWWCRKGAATPNPRKDDREDHDMTSLNSRA